MSDELSNLLQTTTLVDIHAYAEIADFDYRGVSFSERGKWEDDGEARYYVRVLQPYGVPLTISTENMDRWPKDDDHNWHIFAEVATDGRGFWVGANLTLYEAIEVAVNMIKRERGLMR